MDSTEPPIGLRDRHSRDVVLSCEARALEKQRKEAVVTMLQPEGGAFTIASDEGAYLGGDNTAPPPLAYLSSAIAF